MDKINDSTPTHLFYKQVFIYGLSSKSHVKILLNVFWESKWIYIKKILSLISMLFDFFKKTLEDKSLIKKKINMTSHYGC